MLKREWIYIALLVLAGIFIYWQKSSADEEKLKENKEIVKEAEEKYNKSIDSLLVIKDNLDDIITDLESRPPTIIPKYNEKIIYVNVSDSTIIDVER